VRASASAQPPSCLSRHFLTGGRENVRPLLDYRSFELLRPDFCEQLPLQVDRIFNLACCASPGHYQSQTVKTVKSTVMSTLGGADRNDRLSLGGVDEALDTRRGRPDGFRKRW